jgi:hypothetical protein
LIMKNTVFAAMEFSRCARAAPARAHRPAGGLSKLNSAQRSRSTFVLGELGARTQKHRRAERLPG